jgi:hypothetical protein
VGLQFFGQENLSDPFHSNNDFAVAHDDPFGSSSSKSQDPGHSQNAQRALPIDGRLYRLWD